MHIVAFVRWWYGVGWTDQLESARQYLGKVSDYFSISLLAGSLFQPFRQISAGGVRGGLDVQVRAWFDRLISRFIGALVRLFMILAGTVWLLVVGSFMGIWLVLWPLVPFIPLAGLVMSGVEL